MSSWTKYRDKTTNFIKKATIGAINPLALIPNKKEGEPLDDKYFNKTLAAEKSLYDPYIQRGNEAYNTFNPISERYASDPSAYLSEIQGQYKNSPTEQYQRNNILGVADQAGRGSGIKYGAGSHNQIADSLMRGNMQNWVKNYLNTQLGGMDQLQKVYGMGLDSQTSLAGDVGNLYGQQSQLAFNKAREGNKNWFDSLTGLFSAGAGAFGAMGGGRGGGGGGTSGSVMPSQMPSRYHL